MGSSLSAIADDIKDYEYLCKKHNEKKRDVYTTHHYWLEELDEGKTTLSFEEYSYNVDKKKAFSRVSDIDKTIKSLQKEKSDLKEKYKL